MLDISSSENIHFSYFQQWAALQWTSVFISVTSDTWYDAGESHGMSSLWSLYFILVLVKNNFDQKILVIRFLCFRCAIKILRIWHLFIWKLYMLHRESKKLLLNDSDQSIIARAAPPFMRSSGGIMSHCASQMCWHQSQVVMCQNNFDIQVSQFSSFVDSFSSVFCPNNIANPSVLISQVILDTSSNTGFSWNPLSIFEQ